MFLGQGGIVVFEKILYKVLNGVFLEFIGNVFFIKFDGVRESGSVIIKLYVKDEIGEVVFLGQVVSLLLYSDGNFRFFIVENDMKEGLVKSDKGEFNFKILEDLIDIEMRIVKCEIIVRENYESKVIVFLDVKSELVGGYVLIIIGVLLDVIFVRDVYFVVVLFGLVGCSFLRCYFGIILFVVMVLFYNFVQI